MFSGKKKVKKQKPARQDWKPNFLLRILYAAWRVAFGAFKIAVAASIHMTMHEIKIKEIKIAVNRNCKVDLPEEKFNLDLKNDKFITILKLRNIQ